VIYFQKDLANGFMRSEPEFLAYLNRQDFDTAYFKAASHLPHNQGSFSDVTSFVLGKVRFLVQADNGIPFRVLRAQASSWRLRLFGLYAPPSRGFTAGASQSDLSQAYASKLCGRAGARAEQVWAAVWGRCQGNSDNFGFHELTWEGLVPSHYDYSAFSGPGTRNNIAISTPVQRNEMTIFSNLMIAEKVR
jgi:hypothetical protein